MNDQLTNGANGEPLKGRCIAVTRPASQARELISALRELGAEPLSCPTIRIEAPADPIPLLNAVRRLDDYAWVAFTSANGVARFWDVLVQERGEGRWPAGPGLAAIGPATAAALEERGTLPDVVPTEYVGEAVAEALIRLGVSGRRILLPRAAGGRSALPEQLRGAGAEVDDVVAYDTRPEPDGIARLRAGIERRTIDMITFTAPSTVRQFVEATGAQMGEARVAAIGPVTAASARSLGVRVDAVAAEYTVRGLLRAICDYYVSRKGVGE